jgi:hypothetical protein
MIGWATPTVEPLAGTTLGGPNGAVPVNGVGSCPPAPGTPGSGSASAEAGLTINTQLRIAATPAVFTAAKMLLGLQPGIRILQSLWTQCRIRCGAQKPPALSSLTRD